MRGLARASLANRLEELTPKKVVDRPAQPVKRTPKYRGLELPVDSTRGPVMRRRDLQELAWEGARIDFPRVVADAQTLNAGNREAVFLALYDSWHLAHPGEEPDLNFLPEDARLLWKDLDGLGPIEDSYSSSQWKSEEFLTE